MSLAPLKIKQTAFDESLLDEEPISEDGRRVSEQEYWDNYYEHAFFRYEWNDCLLEELPVSDAKNNYVYRWFLILLSRYFEKHPIGNIIFGDFGFRLHVPQKTTIRKPDISIALTTNRITLHDDDRTFKGVFDLCVEAISDLTPKDVKRDVVDKKKEYEAIGVKEYYILDASDRHTAFYRLNDRGYYEPIKPIEDDVIQSSVLPGFKFRISDLYHQPLLEELVEDALYQDFVFPIHNQLKEELKEANQRAEFAEDKAEMERQRAESERLRAEIEKQHAEQERQRAEVERLRAEEAEKTVAIEKERINRLVEQLRSLGVTVE
jgi:hypothetical protein